MQHAIRINLIQFFPHCSLGSFNACTGWEVEMTFFLLVGVKKERNHGFLIIYNYTKKFFSIQVLPSRFFAEFSCKLLFYDFCEMLARRRMMAGMETDMFREFQFCLEKKPKNRTKLKIKIWEI